MEDGRFPWPMLLERHVVFRNHFALLRALRHCLVLWLRGDGSFYNWHDVAGQMEARHFPLAPVALVVALVLILLGCFSLLFGYHTRHGRCCCSASPSSRR